MDRKIIFWGTPDFALPALEVLVALDLVKAVVCQPDKPQGRGKKIIPGPVSSFATEHNLPLLQPPKLDESFHQALQPYLPATFFIVAYGKIIPQAFLDLSEIAAVNIHPSLLPLLRGPSPLQTALLQGNTTTGVTLMQLDAEMDHGPIIAQEEITIDEEDYLPELSAKTAEVGAKLTEQYIRQYLDLKITPTEQEHAKATFCSLITKDDGAIDWQTDAETIRNKVRAYTPWPSAYFFLQNIRFKLLKVNLNEKKLPVGTWQQDGTKILVGTKTTALEILQVQPEGKKPMSSQAFWNGYRELLG